MIPNFHLIKHHEMRPRSLDILRVEFLVQVEVCILHLSLKVSESRKQFLLLLQSNHFQGLRKKFFKIRLWIQKKILPVKFSVVLISKTLYCIFCKKFRTIFFHVFLRIIYFSFLFCLPWWKIMISKPIWIFC